MQQYFTTMLLAVVEQASRAALLLDWRKIDQRYLRQNREKIALSRPPSRQPICPRAWLERLRRPLVIGCCQAIVSHYEGALNILSDLGDTASVVPEGPLDCAPIPEDVIS